MDVFHPVVKQCADIAEMSNAAREAIMKLVAERGDTSKPILLALSGGSTPKKLYEDLHEKDLGALQAGALHFILGDERLVAVEDERSNYSMAQKALLRDIPTELISKLDPTAALATAEEVEGGAAGAWAVARDYEQTLRDVTGCKEGVPVVDVVLLGFGSDGHTASIFPNSIAAQDEEHLVSVSFPSETMNPKVWRITLSKSVIQNAKHVIVLAGGKDKNWVVRGLLEKDVPAEKTPVSRFLRGCTGKVTLVLDAASAEGI